MMLIIDRNTLLNLNLQALNGHRKLLLVISFILLLGGIFCLLEPLISGGVLSVLIGLLLIISGIGMLVGVFFSRARSFWPAFSGILLSAAYIIMGYVFITQPIAGIFALSILFGTLFFFGGLIRLGASWKFRKNNDCWLQLLIGVLDLFIAWIFLSSGPLMSVALVTTIIGIELLLTAFGCFRLANLCKPNA